MAGNPGVLTEAIARALVEEWADGKSFADIIRELRSEGHKVHPCDVTWWMAFNTKVEIFGTKHGLRDLLKNVYPYRIMDLMTKAIEIADGAEKAGEDPRYTKHRIAARFHAIAAMTPKFARVEEMDEDGIAILPHNPKFAKASKDATVN